jgi:DNA-binding transcriptional LysR family regulator
MNMHDMHLRNIDLNLLPVLEALLRHQNVTRAAHDIGLSQPAMSRSLTRLRHLFDDPLLIRAAGGMTLTPRARELIGPVATAAEGIRKLYKPQEFAVGAVKRTVRIAAVDAQTILIAPLIASRLAVEAPHVDLCMEGYAPDLVSRLEQGTLDFAFATAATPLPPGAASMPLADDDLALVMRRGHPAAQRRWTVGDYATYHHASISIFGDGQSELDAALAAQGIRRRIALVTPHFTAALAVVSATDMVTTISRTFAEKFAESFNLVLHPPPLPDITLKLILVWAQLHSGDPFLGWMRGMIREVAQAVHARRSSMPRIDNPGPAA